MTKINDLNVVDSLLPADKLVVWRGSTQAVTARRLAEYVATIVPDLETAATYAELTAISEANRATGDLVYVAARTTPGDGGEGWWRFDALASDVANGGTILAPDAGSGRWLRQYSGAVNVRWFGAKGDGVTDDTAAIQAAINSGAKTVIGKPEDVYAVSATGLLLSGLTGVTLDFSKCVLKITAVATQSISGLGVSSIKFINCSECGIINSEIDGAGFATNLIGFENCSDCFAVGNYLYDGGINGQIVAVGNTGNRYTNNRIENGVGVARGMWVGHYNTVNEIEIEAKVNDNYVSGHNATGIVLTAQKTECTRNLSKDNSGSGIIWSGTDTITSNELRIADNHCENNTFHGIQADAFPTTLSAAPYGISIIGNVCTRNGTGANGTGIYVFKTRDVVIKGNVCNDNDERGIQIGMDLSKNILVQGNTCFETRSGGSRTQVNGIYAIASPGNAENIIIDANIVQNCTGDGITVTTVGVLTLAKINVTNNLCIDNGARGIFIAEATAGAITDCLVSSNNCHNNSTQDIRVSIQDAIIGQNSFDTQSGLNDFIFASGDTTPSVKGRTFFRFNNSTATTVTAFDDPYEGQTIIIRGSDNNTTIQHGGSLDLPGAQNIKVRAGEYLGFQYQVTVWRLVFRSQSYPTPIRTAAQIADITNSINTSSKVIGAMVFDTTNNRLMVSSGTAAASNWYVADGSASVTPS